MSIERSSGPSTTLVAASAAPLLLLLWVVSALAGAVLGASAAIESILALPAHPVLATALPLVVLTAAAVCTWRARWARNALRPLLVSAAAAALFTGPTLLVAANSLSEF